MNLAARSYQAVQRSTAADPTIEHAELVRRIAHHLAARLPPSVDVDDLIQAGMIGLIEASRSYDANQGAAFETYASIRIRGSMIDEIRRGDWVPRSVHRRAREAAAAIREIEQATGRSATAQEVAERLDIPMTDYMRLLENAARGYVLSLDAHVEDHGESEPVGNQAFPTPHETAVRSEFGRELGNAIGHLPEREQLVLSLYYEQDLNLKEIGAVLGVSESRVCQLHGQAVVRLRGRLTAFELADTGIGADD
ncbi:RNA polymerase sigma factor FliA [Luteimonas sp. A478]